MKKKFVEASQLPEEESVYLRKSWGEWSVIHPVKNDDGTTNRMNLLFGGKGNLIRLVVYFLIALIIWYGFSTVIAQYDDIAENPCNYCSSAPSFNFNGFDFNFTIQGGDIG